MVPALRLAFLIYILLGERKVLSKKNLWGYRKPTHLWKVDAIIFVQLRENRKLKYALTFYVIDWANIDLNMTYCLSIEKVCY